MSSNSPVGSQVSLTQFKNLDNKTGEVNNGYIEADDLKDCKSTKNDQSGVAHYDHHIDPANGQANGHVVDVDGSYDESGEFLLKKKEFDPKSANLCSRGVMVAQEGLAYLWNNNKRIIMAVFGIICLMLYVAYFSYAMYYRFGDEGSIRLLVCTIIGVLLLVYNMVVSKRIGFVKEHISKFTTGSDKAKIRRIIRWVLYLMSTVAMVTLIIIFVAIDEPRNLLSLAGLAAFLLICFLTSHSPAMVNWHPIFWGFSVQFYFAIVILKSRWGYETFNWLGDRITEFLAYSNAGAAFVFGDYAKITPFNGPPIEFTGVYTLHYFAFAIMPIITFFSTVISILYYLGIMQAIVKVIGHFLSFCLGTTPTESLNAAANIFVSMTESPLMIRPFLATMTASELHAVMVGGFATIAGGVLGAYIGFGVPADHLLSASVMSAPAALAISKLTYPEVEVPIVKSQNFNRIEKSNEGNVIEAACNGAVLSAKIIACVVVNVMAFLSLLKFVNATLTWFGDRVGIKDFTFELICSYILYPVAIFMGTEPDDCRQVAELVGVKTFTNEFIAYQKLSVLIKNRKEYLRYIGQFGSNMTYHFSGDDLILNNWNNTRLVKGIMSHRSEIIATYALCGFSNIGSMGILLGSLSAMAPSRRKTMARIIFRAMIAGNIACFFTACIAGLFFQEFD
ncbi:solute carrier family 28 member 3 [Biomphalaria pfeifferi]|uniref:Sodium/nucleoside cotransporter n=1 Tax=Biomphalaria pfeifferi TaxID=112525 RepID=A0AAD8BGT5_BIOPF|nr:solute carrier family 28 member 3 [Biomphalaria pfeifferi]